jgi:anti-sigma B factor antagonist
MPGLEDVNVLNPTSGAVVVELVGEHDITTKTDLQELLEVLVIDNQLVVIDVSEATFIDSSVIHVLVGALKRSHECGTHLRLQMGTALIVKRCLELSGILDVFDVVHDRREALSD